MRIFIALCALGYAFALVTPQPTEAPTGFDNKSNGMVDDATHQADQEKFDEIEGVPDGLGPLYNAQSCRECHQKAKPDRGKLVEVWKKQPDGKWKVIVDAFNTDLPAPEAAKK